MRRIAGLSLVLLAFEFIGRGQTPKPGKTPVLLELFTSEGCSSCPPADALLEQLDRSQPVPAADLIALSEHVDYFNYDGWVDPWSSPANTARQNEFVRHFHLNSAYTPQLVVDGQSELVGSDASRARDAINKAVHNRKLTVSLSAPERAKDHLRLHLEVHPSGQDPAASATVYIAIADNSAQSKVANGENRGRALRHVAVVRSLSAVGAIVKGQDFTKEVNLPLNPGVGASGVRIVAFVQDKATGRILGIAQQRLAGS